MARPTAPACPEITICSGELMLAAWQTSPFAASLAISMTLSGAMPRIARKVEETRQIFDISEDSPSDPLAKKPAPDQLDWAYRVSVGLDHLVEDFVLDALAYYYLGVGGNMYERLGAGVILGCSLLTARGIACSGEADLKNCQAMKIMDLLGAGGSYTELYALDFRERFIVMGHDGPFHLAIAEGRPILRGLGL